MIYITKILRTVEGSKLLSLMKECGGVPRFALLTRVLSSQSSNASLAPSQVAPAVQHTPQPSISESAEGQRSRYVPTGSCYIIDDRAPEL